MIAGVSWMPPNLTWMCPYFDHINMVLNFQPIIIYKPYFQKNVMVLYWKYFIYKYYTFNTSDVDMLKIFWNR